VVELEAPPEWLPRRARLRDGAIDRSLPFPVLKARSHINARAKAADDDQVAEEITRRLASIFLRDSHGRRPVHGGARKFQEDPHWRDYLLFYEYFHGDNGAGLGASHQTG
jgi:hypothetical protein